jgi:hypothetical protein
MPTLIEKNLNRIEVCEVCGNTTLLPVLDLGDHAMCDDLIRQGDDRENVKYPIRILYCEECKTAHQQFQIPKTVLFPASYHYRSALTKDVLNGMTELVSSCEQALGSLKKLKVLDIGCNDGSLLSKFSERLSTTFGIEPTGAADEAAAKGHVVLKAFFDEEVAKIFKDKHGSPDIITFTNVFAHIEHLGSVLAALRLLMSEQTLLVVENHYLGAVLSGNQFDTFYHEHPRTYSYSSFKRIADTLGSQIEKIEFPSRYGGNIRVFVSRNRIARKANAGADDILTRESGFKEDFSRLASNVTSWQEKKSAEILHLVAAHGPLRAKAFPGRAAILLELLKLTDKNIAAVYEQPGSPKVGCYIPGTRIPIVSDDELDLTQNAPILNLAWHIQKEIENYLRAKGFTGQIIPIVSDGDFQH